MRGAYLTRVEIRFAIGADRRCYSTRGDTVPTFTLTYARVVILKRRIEAQDYHDAEQQAIALENDSKLGLTTVEIKNEDGARSWLWDAKPDSEIDDIQDEEHVWEIE